MMNNSLRTSAIPQAIFDNGIMYPATLQNIRRCMINRNIGRHLGEFKGIVIMEGYCGDSRVHISYWDKPWRSMRSRKRFMKKRGHKLSNWKKHHQKNPLEKFF